MTQSELLAQLRHLTGDLTAGDAGPDELHALRRRLAASLHAAPAAPPESVPTADECLEPRLLLAIAESTADLPPKGSTLTLIRRETPLAWRASQFAGQAPARTYGPFADALSRPIWFDEFFVGPVLRIAWPGQPGPTLVLPAHIVLPGATRLQFGACSIWIASAALAAAAPKTAFSGWKVTKATIDLSAAGTVSGDTLTLPANATVRVTFVPDNSELAAPPAGPGVDAANTTITSPPQATLNLKNGRLTSISAGDAAISTLGLDAALTRTQAPPSYDAFLQRVFVPFAAHIEDLAIASASTLATLAGRGKLLQAAWSPSQSNTAPEQLGDAISGGALVLVADGDFTAAGAGVERGPLRLGRTYLLADRGLIGVLAPAASNLTASYPLSLWPTAELRLLFDHPLPFAFLSSRSVNEVVEYQGTLSASLDRPLQADGSKLRIRFPATPLLLFQTSAGISTFGSVTMQPVDTRTALALSNGLFTVTPPIGMQWNGQLPDPSSIASGTLVLTFGVFQLLPTLPDPYAASFESVVRADAPRGRLQLTVTWAGDGDPQLTFAITSGTGAQGSPDILPSPVSTPLFGPAEMLRRDYYFLLNGQIDRAADTRNLRLLDLSTNADQLGVNLGYRPEAPGTVQVRGVDVVSLGGSIDVMMLPQVQWEPVQVLQNPNVGVLPKQLDSPDDGGPALVGARSIKLVPIAPMPIAEAVVKAHNVDSQPATALFTLPFGIYALASFNPAGPLAERRARIDLRQIAFNDSFTAATQIRLTRGRQIGDIGDGALLPIVIPRPPLLPGFAVQLLEATDPAGTHIFYYKIVPPPLLIELVDGGPPPYSVLSPLDSDFNNTFAPPGQGLGVPIQQIDLSGYGESCFSNWNNNVEIGITNVTFEVLNGRTKYEVLRMRSRLAPCDAVVVRTITLERRPSGNVYRWDSGWVAVTDGLFEWKGTDIRCHTGAVRGYYNIRAIRDTPGAIPVTGGAEVEVVYFDTDIEMDHVVAGGGANNRVTARNQLGFVQRVPISNGEEQNVPLLNAAQLAELIGKYSAGGAIDCMLDIGGSGQKMRLHSVFCETAPPAGAGTPQFAVAGFGSPIVPGNQSWSFSRIDNGAGTAAPVDPNRGVPLIRQGGTSVIPASGPYRFADPRDLLQANPAADYALQLTTGTHRMLFPRPEITPGKPALAATLSPILADPFALVGSAGPFPKISSCLQLQPATYRLDILAAGYRWAAPAGGMTFTIPDLEPSRQRFLIRSSAFNLRADYGGLSVLVKADAAAPWSINIPRVPTVLDVKTPDFGSDILSVVSDLFTPGADGALLKGPEVVFGAALDTAKQIITALQAFLPGGPPLDIDLSAPSASDPSLRLRITARFPIAQPDGSAIDIGIGKLRGEIDVGTQIQLSLPGFGGRIFFTVKGELQQALLPALLYVGGSLQLDISIDESGKPGVKLVTSTVASIGGDLIPLLVELEGSCSYGWFLDTNAPSFVPGVALGMEVRAKLLAGFLGVRMRADVSVGATVDPLGAPLFASRDLYIQGEFTAMLSVVAAWVFEKDFSKTLRFHQEIPGVVAGAFAVATGIVPVPV